MFVTGTGTGIGKTTVCACLARHWGAAYWKPVQTGVATDAADSDQVAALGGEAVSIFPPRHVFRAPLSPEAAAALEGQAVRLEDFNLPTAGRPIVVEGAGGVLVPLNASSLTTDLMVRLSLPVILVAATGLGTINHTLLSLAALRARHLTVAGVILVGDENTGNAQAIARHGAVRVLHRLPLLSSLSAASIAAAAANFPSLDSVLA